MVAVALAEGGPVRRQRRRWRAVGGGGKEVRGLGGERVRGLGGEGVSATGLTRCL